MKRQLLCSPKYIYNKKETIKNRIEICFLGIQFCSPGDKISNRLWWSSSKQQGRRSSRIISKYKIAKAPFQYFTSNSRIWKIKIFVKRFMFFYYIEKTLFKKLLGGVYLFFLKSQWKKKLFGCTVLIIGRIKQAEPKLIKRMLIGLYWLISFFLFLTKKKKYTQYFLFSV